MTDRPELDELLRRRALTEDAARPDAVERRHAAGGRTARENIADLVDPGTFVEVGGFVELRADYFGVGKMKKPGDGVSDRSMV